MATAKQIEANRRNALKSTGPKTAEGKDRSRWNSLKHGLTADAPVLPHEDPEAFEQLRAALFESWQPANAQELLLVEQIAHGQWRMERAQRLETAMFKAQLRALKARHNLAEAPTSLDDEGIAIELLNPENQSGYRTLFRYDTRAQATFYRAVDRLRQLQADRRRAEASAPAAFPAGPKPHTAPLLPVAAQQRTPATQIGFVSHLSQSAEFPSRDPRPVRTGQHCGNVSIPLFARPGGNSPVC